MFDKSMILQHLGCCQPELELPACTLGVQGFYANTEWLTTFSLSSFSEQAHLDNAAAGLLEVVHLLAQGQRQLVGLRAAAEVLAGKGPVQDGHRACTRQTQSYSQQRKVKAAT